MGKIISKKRIIVALLALILLFPVPVLGLDEPAAESAEVNNEISGETDEINADSLEPDNQAIESDIQSYELEMQTPDTDTQLYETEPQTLSIDSQVNEAEPQTSDADTKTDEPGVQDPDPEPQVKDISLRVSYKAGDTLTLEWDGPKDIDGAVQCVLFRDNDEGKYQKIAGTEDKLSYTYTGLDYSTEYVFRVEYYDESGKTIAASDELKAVSAVQPPLRRNSSLGSFTIEAPVRLLTNGNNFNLREYAGETNTGYAIVEGSCTDGTYSYHCMVNTNSDWGRLVKVRMSDNALMAVSDPYDFSHGNGMCFDSKRNRLVIASYDDYRRTINFVDPDDLKPITPQGSLVLGSSFKNRLQKEGYEGNVGATSISYNAKYDCFITMQKSEHNIIIYDAETLEAKAIAMTDFDESFTGIFQSTDADDTYVYFLLSKDGSSQPNNILVAFDWHAEKLEALLNGTSTEDMWWCGEYGEHAAVITVNGAHEIESMYHIDTGDGTSHFYLANYNNDPVYRTVTKKVKWKKVKKKVKVKWKKVKKKVKWKKVKKKVKWKKVNGKWKYKTKKVWKYKTKKVWKYKYKTKKVWKYKKVKQEVFDYYNRDNYILDLGVF